MPTPPRILAYGVEGIGKSTFASETPQPVFVQTEDGLGQIECDKFPLAGSFEEVHQALGELHTEDHDFETVVIDSLDWLERLIWDAVCNEYGVKSIEKADGGYARGYTHALVYWRQIVDALNALRNDRNMVVLLIAHTKVERFEDPESSAYDRYSPRLHKHAAALVSEWCDAVLFATRKIRTQTEDAGFNRKRSIARAWNSSMASSNMNPDVGKTRRYTVVTHPRSFKKSSATDTCVHGRSGSDSQSMVVVTPSVACSSTNWATCSYVSSEHRCVYDLPSRSSTVRTRRSATTANDLQINLLLRMACTSARQRLIANLPRPAFLNRDSLPLALTSR